MPDDLEEMPRVRVLYALTFFFFFELLGFLWLLSWFCVVVYVCIVTMLPPRRWIPHHCRYAATRCHHTEPRRRRHAVTLSQHTTDETLDDIYRNAMPPR